MIHYSHSTQGCQILKNWRTNTAVLQPWKQANRLDKLRLYQILPTAKGFFAKATRSSIIDRAETRVSLRALSCTQHNLLSTPMHVSLLVCSRRKADFPPQQTGSTTLGPGEACRRKAEVRSSANDTWCYFTDLHTRRLHTQQTGKRLA